ncbi:MAG: hypothetical protein KatS3mg057_1623 [Herpetosiphonaceae bacterium]|nr:MAG: hypothetical protein KatS3mg057_1623 [Herpetosiphonaceae bacterium]
MATSEDRLRILRMIEAGQISAEEGARLLGALDEGERSPSRPAAQWIRVRVTDLETGRQKVNVNIPAGLIGVGIRLGARFGGGEHSPINVEELLTSIRSGSTGKIVDVEDPKSNERVEIIVE